MDVISTRWRSVDYFNESDGSITMSQGTQELMQTKYMLVIRMLEQTQKLHKCILEDNVEEVLQCIATRDELMENVDRIDEQLKEKTQENLTEISGIQKSILEIIKQIQKMDLEISATMKIMHGETQTFLKNQNSNRKLSKKYIVPETEETPSYFIDKKR